VNQAHELPIETAAALRAARARLGRLASQILYFPTVGSTNDVAAVLASSDRADGALVLADQQTAGRGRRGHSWFSPPASGLYVSVVMMPALAQVDPSRATLLLTLAAGVAIAEGVEAASGLRPSLKWPNDLFIGRRKVGGILAETAGAASVVLGYGVNLRETAFPPEIADRATSLDGESGSRVDRTAVLVETLAALARRYDDLLNGRCDAILDAWRAHAPASVGSRVEWSTDRGPCAGITAGVDANGALLVHVEDRLERIVAGELTWHY
jgi:BirA family biotin operon repressor/biotin-[acetyl-CoA-carboxylase] ligase